MPLGLADRRSAHPGLWCLAAGNRRFPPLEANKKAARIEPGGLESGENLPNVDYGEYVIVRTPATLLIVIVVPCEKPAGYDSFATEFSTLTYDVGPRRSERITDETPFSR